MPEIEIRPAIEADIPTLTALDHSYTTEYVWQMDVGRKAEGRIEIVFRQVRLPRSVRIEYPRRASHLAENWAERDGLLVAVHAGQPVGYAGFRLDVAPLTAWVSDLVVSGSIRRKGIGASLLLAAEEWAEQHDCQRLILEVQPKNFPAIRLAQKIGFDFCGYNDRYYANEDIGLFFGKYLW